MELHDRGAVLVADRGSVGGDLRDPRLKRTLVHVSGLDLVRDREHEVPPVRCHRRVPRLGRLRERLDRGALVGTKRNFGERLHADRAAPHEWPRLRERRHPRDDPRLPHGIGRHRGVARARLDPGGRSAARVRHGGVRGEVPPPDAARARPRALGRSRVAGRVEAVVLGEVRYDGKVRVTMRSTWKRFKPR